MQAHACDVGFLPCVTVKLVLTTTLKQTRAAAKCLQAYEIPSAGEFVIQGLRIYGGAQLFRAQLFACTRRRVCGCSSALIYAQHNQYVETFLSNSSQNKHC